MLRHFLIVATAWPLLPRTTSLAEPWLPINTPPIHAFDDDNNTIFVFVLALDLVAVAFVIRPLPPPIEVMLFFEHDDDDTDKKSALYPIFFKMKLLLSPSPVVIVAVVKLVVLLFLLWLSSLRVPILFVAATANLRLSPSVNKHGVRGMLWLIMVEQASATRGAVVVPLLLDDYGSGCLVYSFILSLFSCLLFLLFCIVSTKQTRRYYLIIFKSGSVPMSQKKIVEVNVARLHIVNYIVACARALVPSW